MHNCKGLFLATRIQRVKKSLIIKIVFYIKVR